MSTTDNPLKRLIYTFINDFAPWLLNNDIQFVHPLNIELPAQADLIVDQAFRVALPNGKETILHVEFQGRSTHRPMKWRMLEYMSRFAETYKVDVFSVVIYVGQGVGARDQGQHQVQSPDGEVSLHWRYRVIRLWQIKAEDLLSLNSPPLTSLIGQTHIENPDEILPLAIQQIQTVPDELVRGNLLNLLQTLIEDEELSQMVQKLFEEEALLMNTPFLRRIRAEGRREGRDEGRREGRDEGRREGRDEGRREGQMIAQRDHIINILALRFDPRTSISLSILKQLKLITDPDILEELFTLALQGDALETFQARLNEILSQQDEKETLQVRT